MIFDSSTDQRFRSSKCFLSGAIIRSNETENSRAFPIRKIMHSQSGGERLTFGRNREGTEGVVRLRKLCKFERTIPGGRR